MRRTAALLFLCLVGLLCSFGCSSKDEPTAPISTIAPLSEPAPEPNSPANVLRLLEWSYNYRDENHYRTLFTSDCLFLFASLDSSGSTYGDARWTREDEMISAHRLFQVTSKIQLRFDGNLTATPDPRPGKHPMWHKVINTHTQLHLVFRDHHVEDIFGPTTFFLVRGDSASIPADIGAGPDSSVWYIDGWQDQTASHAGGTPNSAWTSLKKRYRDLYWPD